MNYLTFQTTLILKISNFKDEFLIFSVDQKENEMRKNLREISIFYKIIIYLAFK